MFGSEKKQPASEAHWIPLADLMTGLMMMFMLIAVLYMLKINSAAESYSKTKNELGTALCTEFSKDLKQKQSIRRILIYIACTSVLR